MVYAAYGFAGCIQGQVYAESVVVELDVAVGVFDVVVIQECVSVVSSVQIHGHRPVLGVIGESPVVFVSLIVAESYNTDAVGIVFCARSVRFFCAGLFCSPVVGFTGIRIFGAACRCKQCGCGHDA